MSPAQFDPSDVYFQGYLAARSAEQLEAAGDFIGAMEKLSKAQQMFGAVQRYYPDWKPEMVKARSSKTSETIRTLKDKSDAQLQKNRNQVAELEGGVKKSVQPLMPKEDPPTAAPGVFEADPIATRRLREAEAEVKRLSEMVNRNRLEQNRGSSQLSDIQRERDSLANQLKIAQARLESSQSNGSNEAARDASRVEDLRKQRDAMANELRAAQQKMQMSQSQDRAEQARDAARMLDLQRQRDTLAGELKTAQARLETLKSRDQSEQSRDASRVEDLRKQRDTLASELRDAQQKLEASQARDRTEQSRDDARMQDLQRQRDTLENDLRTAQNHVESLRSRLAAAPLEKDLNALNGRIATLEQEREAMAMALKQSRSSHTDALARIATLEADMQVMQQKRSDLDRDLKEERKISNSVVAGQRRQLEALEKQLTQKNAELTKANERINGLVQELQQSRDAFAQLRTERDSLLQERDQMSALLKLNEGGRIQDLIEQNMALAKNLRESNEKVERLNRESNADKDAINAAQRDLAIAKAQINRLHQDKQEQDQRIADLEQRLKKEEADLAQGKTSADPAEVEVLRDIIKRQVRVQERRRQARNLLVDAAKELGAKDERYKEAIAMLDGEEVALTPEEQKLLADKQVDGEFISPFARDRATVGKATTELERDIAVYERTAEKSFVSGKLLPCRELYQMILEQHPGHTPSLCRLGVVHLKLDDAVAAVDTFRRAVELDANNPYAYRMLGFSLMKTGDLPAAEQSVRHSVDLAPNDAKSQSLLAMLCYRLGKTGEAESFFKAAINADPMPSEPYFNLALICARDRRYDQAKDYYQQALERGAIPDTALQETLSKH